MLQRRGFSGVSVVRNPPAKQETWVQPLGWEDPQDNKTANHCSMLDWEIPWATVYWGHKRAVHDLATKQHTSN